VDQLVRLFDCVTSISTDGKNVFVASDTDNGHSSLAQIQPLGLEVNPANDPFAQWLAEIRFRVDITAHQERLVFPDRRASWYVGSEGAIHHVKFLPGTTPRILVHRMPRPGGEASSELKAMNLSLSLPPRLSRLSRLELTDLSATSGMIFAGFNDPYPDGGLFSAVVAIDTQTDCVHGFFGAPSPTRKEHFEIATPEDKWWNRRLRFLSATEYGFLVADRTDYDQEEKRISYYVPTERNFFLVDIPSEDLGGIFFYQTGIVVSLPMSGEVVWMGPKAKVPFANRPTRSL
jgi:hypothetical protein